jgi:hypothetical protein
LTSCITQRDAGPETWTLRAAASSSVPATWTAISFTAMEAMTRVASTMDEGVSTMTIQETLSVAEAP